MYIDNLHHTELDVNVSLLLWYKKRSYKILQHILIKSWRNWTWTNMKDTKPWQWNPVDWNHLQQRMMSCQNYVQTRDGSYQVKHNYQKPAKLQLSQSSEPNFIQLVASFNGLNIHIIVHYFKTYTHMHIQAKYTVKYWYLSNLFKIKQK